MTQKYELETRFVIHNNNTGDRVEVSDDRDGLGLTDVTQFAHDGTEIGRISLVKEQLSLLIKALEKRAQ